MIVRMAGDNSAMIVVLLVATLCAMRHGVAPPTINWLGLDPRCIADPVANVARAQDMDFAMTNSFAFGGITASLIIKRAG